MPATAAEQGDPPLYHDPASPEPGSPVLIVPPEFPKDAAARRQAGAVDVEAIVDRRDGRLRDWKLLPVAAADAVFVPAVAEVIGYWRFERELDECRPVDAPIRTRVWFEWAGDEPKVSMERRAREWGGKPVAAFNPLRRVPPRYPSDMLRAGYISDVYALMRIEADGVPTKVETVVYPMEAAKRLAPFEAATRNALMTWRYPPRKEGPWLNCVVVSFRLNR